MIFAETGNAELFLSLSICLQNSYRISVQLTVCRSILIVATKLLIKNYFVSFENTSIFIHVKYVYSYDINLNTIYKLYKIRIEKKNRIKS